MLNKDDIAAYWLPNKTTGFLPQIVATKPTELAASNDYGLQLIGSVAPRLGKISDTELEELVLNLPSKPDTTPAQATPAMCEGIVRAYVNIAAHLIHRPHFVDRKELPAPIAGPLWDFSLHVKRPPSLTYASYVLTNFTLPVQPRMLPEAFDIAQTPTGTTDEAWFTAAHLSVESVGGEVVEAIDTIEEALHNKDMSVIIAALNSIESCMNFATSVLPLIMDRMSADVFLNQIRPLLYGYDHIVFRGVEGDRIVAYVGETGAQSGVIRAVDAILNIQHSSEITSTMSKFLMCAPPVHQQFFERAGLLGKRLNEIEAVRSARHSVALALAEFRKAHLAVVAHYLMPNGKKLAEFGTGGTRLTEWLKKLVDETKKSA